MLASAMPSEITRERIAAIAALANLELDPSELELFARQLGDVLAYADEVLQVDTTGVPPTAAVSAESRDEMPPSLALGMPPSVAVGTAPCLEREDEVRPSLDVQEVLANAPDALPPTGFFRVPRVLG